MAMCCPKCHGDRVQAVSVLVAGPGGVVSRTAPIAPKLREPLRPGGGMHAVAWFLCAVAGGLAHTATHSDGFALIVFVSVMVLYVYGLYKPAKHAWEIEHAQWRQMYESAWFCHSCGEVFTPDAKA